MAILEHLTPRRIRRNFDRLRVIQNIRSIKSRDFSIIASNCTGALPYRFLGMPYTSPTVNLFFFAPCYLRFVRNLDHYLAQPLMFSPVSRYRQGELTRAVHGQYPVGLLDDVEIHFMHYSCETDAEAKWNRRKTRINRDNLIYAFTDKDLCTPELLEAFDSLEGARKYVLTSQFNPGIQSAIQVPHFEDRAEIGDCYTHFEHLSHIDFRTLIDIPEIPSQHNQTNVRKLTPDLEADSLTPNR